jgi:hypothetical protein
MIRLKIYFLILLLLVNCYTLTHRIGNQETSANLTGKVEQTFLHYFIFGNFPEKKWKEGDLCGDSNLKIIKFFTWTKPIWYLTLFLYTPVVIEYECY